MKKEKITLRKLPLFGTVWHEETSFVFQSTNILVVIGKLVENQIIPLTDTDIKVCEKYKFRRKDNLLGELLIIIKEQSAQIEKLQGTIYDKTLEIDEMGKLLEKKFDTEEISKMIDEHLDNYNDSSDPEVVTAPLRQSQYPNRSFWNGDYENYEDDPNNWDGDDLVGFR